MNLNQAQQLVNTLIQLCEPQMKQGYMRPRILPSEKVGCAQDMGEYVILIAFEISKENDKVVDSFINQHNLKFCWDIWDKREWKVLYSKN